MGRSFLFVWRSSRTSPGRAQPQLRCLLPVQAAGIFTVAGWVPVSVWRPLPSGTVRAVTILERGRPLCSATLCPTRVHINC